MLLLMQFSMDTVEKEAYDVLWLSRLPWHWTGIDCWLRLRRRCEIFRCTNSYVVCKDAIMEFASEGLGAIYYQACFAPDSQQITSKGVSGKYAITMVHTAILCEYDVFL